MKILALILFFSSLAYSASDIVGIDPNDPTVLRQDGHFLTLRLVVGEPLRLFVLGKEEAKLDLSNLKLTVRRTQPYPAQNLNLAKKGDYFIITDPHGRALPQELEVTAETKEKTETLRFKLESLK